MRTIDLSGLRETTSERGNCLRARSSRCVIVSGYAIIRPENMRRSILTSREMLTPHLQQ